VARRARELTQLQEVRIAARPPARFKAVLSEAQYSGLLAEIERAHAIIGARVIWNVNSTARGGGVAELLQSLVAYVRGAGFDCRWTVIAGEPDFFALTKRLHTLEETMLGTFHLIRDLALASATVVVLAIAAWIAIDYGAAIIVAVGGFALVGLALPFVTIYEEEHDLPFNRHS